MELLLIRHGLPETAHADAGADPALAPSGRADADLLGRYLAAHPEQVPDVVYTSPMRRAVETAEALVRHTPVPFVVDPRLREFDHGAPSYVPPELMTPEVATELWQALETGVHGSHRFDPEVFEQTVEAVLSAVIDGHPARVVAVVCHSGVINSFVGRLLDRPRGMFFRPEYTSVSRVVATGGGRRRLLSLNETPHLGATAAASRTRPA